MQLFNNILKVYHIDCINRMKLSLEHLWVIERWLQGDKVENKYTKKLREIHYIKDNELTEIGKNIHQALINMEEPVGKKKVVKQVTIPTKYDVQWDQLWSMWPAMRSFTWKGTKFTCNKPFKSNEQKLKLKYIAAIENGDVTAEQINKAAKTALSWCMENSYRKGRNEMEYMNGLEPWIHQRQWLNWMNIAPPVDDTSNTQQNQMIGI